MMETKELSFSYGKKTVLRDITLSFESGKLYAVIGSNGSGKTTLIKLLSRQTNPKHGTLFLDGKSYDTFERKEFARQVALFPQGRNTPNTSVLELVSCGRFPYLGLSRQLTDGDREAVQKALAATDTEAFASRNIKTLSGGERQRVYMAMLYAQDTPYVLLDEPAAHLDISAGFEIMELLTQMKGQGKCVISVLHNLSSALKYADQIVLIREGEVCICGVPEEIIASGLLETVFHVKCTPILLEGETEYIFTHI